MVARWLGLAAPVHSGRSAVRGVAEFPQGHGLRKEIQQFIHAEKRVGFVPMTDKDIYWFLTCPSPAKGSNIIPFSTT